MNSCYTIGIIVTIPWVRNILCEKINEWCKKPKMNYIYFTKQSEIRWWWWWNYEIAMKWRCSIYSQIQKVQHPNQHKQYRETWTQMTAKCANTHTLWLAIHGWWEKFKMKSTIRKIVDEKWEMRNKKQKLAYVQSDTYKLTQRHRQTLIQLTHRHTPVMKFIESMF